jgi:hypothetical protein
MTQAEILVDHSELESEDIAVALACAATALSHPLIAAAE